MGVLRGSARQSAIGVSTTSLTDSPEPLTVTVRLRRRGGTAPPDEDAAAPTLTPAEFAAAYGADPDDVDQVSAAATAAGLAVSDVNLAGRSLKLTGPASVIQQFFSAELVTVHTAANESFRDRNGTLSVPDALDDIVVGAFGLSERHVAHPLSPIVAAAATGTPFSPVTLGSMYDFPTATGVGQTIRIVEFGGGWDSAEVATYLTGLGIPAASQPTITDVFLDGATNDYQPTDNSGTNPDFEVMLDVEVVAALAPGASIVLIFAPNSEQGFIDAFQHAIHSVPGPGSISVSWGGPESLAWTNAAMTELDGDFADAGALGISVLVASGDFGSHCLPNASWDHVNHVSFPASAPHALGVGGTDLTVSGTTITSERVWNDGLAAGNGASGGGISDVFPVPGYQAGSAIPVSANPDHRVGRGVPDVSAYADPSPGYAVSVHGSPLGIGGTSAGTPLWAALVARLNEKLPTPLRFLNPTLYALHATTGALKTFRDILQGSNGGYAARVHWDACTGLGSPDGNGLLAALSGSSAVATRRVRRVDGPVRSTLRR